MSDPCGPEGNRNALLALHYREGDPRTEAETRAHASGCPACQEYLAVLEGVEGTLRTWVDEEPPAGVWEQVQARTARGASRPVRAPALPGAAALLALLPGMAACLALVQVMAGQLASLPFWPQLVEWPAVHFVGSFGVAVLLLLMLGGLGTLALAPALLLDSRRDARLSAA